MHSLDQALIQRRAGKSANFLWTLSRSPLARAGLLQPRWWC
jgi:hypothetical protein